MMMIMIMMLTMMVTMMVMIKIGTKIAKNEVGLGLSQVEKKVLKKSIFAGKS